MTDTKDRRRTILVESIIALVLAGVAILGIHLFIGRDLREIMSGSPQAVFAIEIAVFTLLLAPFVMYEMMKLVQFLRGVAQPDAPEGRTTRRVLAAFAGSLAIYLCFIWADNLVSPRKPVDVAPPANPSEASHRQ